MEIILSNFENHPSCPHGPCLLFERYASDGSKTGRRFFACSACRDRTECSFFQWADDEMSENRKKRWQEIILEKRPPYAHEECTRWLEVFKTLPVEKRKYCETCSVLILNELEKHTNHDIKNNISLQDMLQPSCLFRLHENKKVEAQYFFNKSTVHFVVSLLRDLGFSKLVSIGVPKIHEHVISSQNNGLSSFLMDIDYRYMQFFSPEQFCHYNMFNNHFFNGKVSKKIFKNYLSENQNGKVVIMLDPPFGGLIDAISYTLKKVNKWWQKKNKRLDGNIPIIWVFPYFHEGRILKNLPDMKMMDYKVQYDNHKKFGKTKSSNSPVRIFTNIEASRFVLPTECGYRFCDECKRYVSEENQHCSKCKTCTTKHGKTYHHCDVCQQCVKSSYVHCLKCNTCGPSSSDISKICKNCKCNGTKEDDVTQNKCFKCNGIGHRKRNCPEGLMRHIKRRKAKKT